MEHPTPSRHLSRRRVSAPATTPIGPKVQGAPIETLFFHPSVKVVSFTAQVRALSLDPDNAREEAGTLPSSSQTERTIAVGSLRIYRAPGSVAFLSCGAALQPILPKSQCWCIDEINTIYVFQVRRPTFWRIELPTTTAEYQEMASQLKKVLDKVLQFEKTYCPFQRTFSVELPEQPETPIKKIPWTPKHLPGSTKSPDAEIQGNLSDIEPTNSYVRSSPIAQAKSTSLARDREGTTDGHVENSASGAWSTVPSDKLIVDREAALSSKCTEARDLCRERNPGQVAPYDHSPPTTVAGIVDDIHDRFGRFTAFGSVDGRHLGLTARRDHTNMPGSSIHIRRHSFGSVMKRPSQVTDEHPFLEPLMTASSGGEDNKSRWSITRSESSMDMIQCSKSIYAVKELSTTSSNPARELPHQRASQASNIGNTAGLRAPLAAATTKSMTLQLSRHNFHYETPRVSGSFESSRNPTSADGLAGSQRPSAGMVQTPSQSERSGNTTTTELKLRNTMGAQRSPTSSPRLVPREGPTPKPAPFPAPTQRPSLPMNIISRTYDALLLPVAYVIALMLKVIARLLFIRRGEPIPTVRKYSNQVPAFLQYTEDELTE